MKTTTTIPTITIRGHKAATTSTAAASYVPTMDAVTVESVKDYTLDVRSTFAETVAANNIHIALTASIVRKIAGIPNHRNGATCSSIIQHGGAFDAFRNRFKWSDEIMEDAIQSVYIALLEMEQRGEVSIQDSKLVFGSYVGKNGESKPAFLRLYQAIEQCFASYRVESDPKHRIIAYDALVQGESGNEFTENNTSTRYLRDAAMQNDGGLDALLDREDIDTFMAYAARTMKTGAFEAMKQVFFGLAQGMKQADIADMMGISQQAVAKRVVKMREVYRAWCSHYGAVDVKGSYSASGSKHGTGRGDNMKHGTRGNDKSGSIPIHVGYTEGTTHRAFTLRQTVPYLSKARLILSDATIADIEAPQYESCLGIRLH